MPQTRIPSPADFAPLSSVLPHALHYPTPKESTTAILVVFHGLGDSHESFSSFARNLALPGVLAVTVRGVNPVPPFLLPSPPATTNVSSSSSSSSSSSNPASHFHWGDDLRLDARTGELDPDPGFEKACGLVCDRLIRQVLVDQCGWETEDVILLGYGQGASLALGIARRMQGKGEGKGKRFKGVVAISGGLPRSMVPSESGRSKAKTRALVLCGRESESVDEDMEELLRDEFESVKVVRWQRREDGMPRNKEEVWPMMEFLGSILREDGMGAVSFGGGK